MTDANTNSKRKRGRAGAAVDAATDFRDGLRQLGATIAELELAADEGRDLAHVARETVWKLANGLRFIDDGVRRLAVARLRPADLPVIERALGSSRAFQIGDPVDRCDPDSMSTNDGARGARWINNGELFARLVAFDRALTHAGLDDRSRRIAELLLAAEPGCPADLDMWVASFVEDLRCYAAVFAAPAQVAR